MELAIIGGGAAGMMAALTAAEWTDRSVVLLERQPRLAASCWPPATAAVT